MRLGTIPDLLKVQVRDLHSAESLLVASIPLMAARVYNPELREGFERHLEQTKEHVRRLEQIADQMGFSPGGARCLGMLGIIQEGQEAMGMYGEPGLVDRAVISAARKVEHYEMAAYLSARSLAEQGGLSEIVELLDATLAEEEETDMQLEKLSEQDDLSATQPA